MTSRSATVVPNLQVKERNHFGRCMSKGRPRRPFFVRAADEADAI